MTTSVWPPLSSDGSAIFYTAYHFATDDFNSEFGERGYYMYCLSLSFVRCTLMCAYRMMHGPHMQTLLRPSSTRPWRWPEDF